MRSPAGSVERLNIIRPQTMGQTAAAAKASHASTGTGSIPQLDEMPMPQPMDPPAIGPATIHSGRLRRPIDDMTAPTMAGTISAASQMSAALSGYSPTVTAASTATAAPATRATSVRVIAPKVLRDAADGSAPEQQTLGGWSLSSLYG